MEHRLIEGGEQFLPFARSCVAKLKKLGLPYADQSYEVDGVSIKVRIEPGHEFIKINGGVTSLSMDSGFVEGHYLGSYAYSAANLLETVSAKNYNSSFLPTDPPTDWKFNKSGSGQYSGTIDKTPKGVTGKVQYDDHAAKSFSPKTVAPLVDGGTWTPSVDDATLFAKKVVSVACKPSVFTGKCRLYAQAMYGQPLYYGKDGSAKANFVPRLDSSNPGAAPAILVESYRPRGQPAEYPEVSLNTSCGVYLDTQTGRHWLFKPVNGGAVWVYPLVGTSEAEAFRTKLKKTVDLPNGGTASAEDYEHLEAFILSTCLPDVKNKAVCIGGTGNIPAYSMGYGWHWNWSGTCADIVINDMAQHPGEDPVMLSTHYRLTIVYTGDDWHASTSIVEGPSEWAVERLNWCITEPLWVRRSQVKTTPKYSQLKNCDAPFYAFYSRDVLKTCRVNVKQREPDPETMEFTEGFLGETGTSSPTGEAYRTLGLRGGHIRITTGGRDNVHYGAQWVGKFTVGDEVVDDQYLGRYERVFYREIKDVAQTGVYGGETYDYFAYTLGNTTPYPYGYPDAVTGLYSFDTFRSATRTWTSTGFSYTYRKSTIDISYVSAVTIIIPLDDSEAVFMKASQEQLVSDLTTDESWGASLNSFGLTVRPEQEAGVRLDGHGGTVVDVNWIGPYYTRYIWKTNGIANSDELFGSTAPFVVDTITTVTNFSGLITKSGTYAAEFSGTSQFHNNSAYADEIFDLYEANSGTKIDVPTVCSVGRTEFVGANSHTASRPVLLGWV